MNMMTTRGSRRVAEALAQDRAIMSERIERYAQRRKRFASLPESRRAVEARYLEIEGADLREQARILDRVTARENEARKRHGLVAI